MPGEIIFVPDKTAQNKVSWHSSRTARRRRGVNKLFAAHTGRADRPNQISILHLSHLMRSNSPRPRPDSPETTAGEGESGEEDGASILHTPQELLSARSRGANPIKMHKSRYASGAGL